MKILKRTIFLLVCFFMIGGPAFFYGGQLVYAIDTNKIYFTVYEGSTKEKVLFLKGDDVSVGDQYLSHDNKLYEIVSVDENQKIAYTKFLRNENLPTYNVKAKSVSSTSTAKATKMKKIGVYHTHNDESYYTPDGTDSVYGKGGIHDVGKALVENFEKLDVDAIYREDLHLPHNSGAYTRSQVTASALLNEGVDAIFDIHRDSTKRSEYLTTVGGAQMSAVRMVVGKSSANFEENKKFAYSIKSYADSAYPGFIKDVYFGKGNYNQQLSTRAMLFEFGCENIEKDLAIKSTEILAKTLDVVLYGSDGASELALKDVDLSSDNGNTSVITGLVSSNGTSAGVDSNETLFVILGIIGAVLIILTVVLICSKKARYKVGRFFSEMFAGIFGKKRNND